MNRVFDQIKKFFPIILIIVLTVLNSISASERVPASKFNGENIKLNRKQIQLKVGKTKTIKLKNAPRKVKWKVANKKVAKIVRKSGKKNNIIKIKGIKAGKTKITARCNNKKYVVKVTVKKNAKPQGKNEIVTTENVTIKPSETVTTKPTQEVTTKPTEEAITTFVEEITTGPTTENSSSEYNIIGRPEYYEIKSLDNLDVTYTIESEGDEEFTYDSMPYILLKNVDGERAASGDNSEKSVWEIVKDYTEDKSIVRETNTIKGNVSFSVSVPLEEYFGKLAPGKYQYVHVIEGHSVSVYFSIVDDEKSVTLEVTNSPVTLGDNFQIKLTSKGYASYDNGPNTGYEIGKLEIYEDEEWKEVECIGGTYIEPAIVFPNSSFSFTVDLSGNMNAKCNAVFKDLRAGHYRYSHEVSGEYVSGEFDIVEEQKAFDVTGRVVNDNLCVNDMLHIEFTITGKDLNNWETTTYSSKPETLEILENDQWKQLTYKENVTIPEVNIGRLGSGISIFNFTPNKYYENIEIGHYRYTHTIEGKKVTVEFDIVEDNIEQKPSSEIVVGEEPDIVIAKIVDNKITIGDDLVINYTINGKDAFETTSYYKEPRKLEIYEDGQWIEMEINHENVKYYDVDHVVFGSVSFDVTIPLSEYYLDLREGHYRYTNTVGTYEVPVEFDIVE